MNSDGLMIVQLAAVALLASLVLVAWGDLGGLAFVRRMNAGAKFFIGVAAMAGMVGVLAAPNFLPIDRSPSTGAALDLNWPLISVADGKEVNLSSFKGKVVFVNLWATWCPPCVREMPSIEALYREFADRDDVAFVLISLDRNIEKPKDHAASNGMKAPIYLSKVPPPMSFQSEGIPMTVI